MYIAVVYLFYFRAFPTLHATIQLPVLAQDQVGQSLSFDCLSCESSNLVVQRHLYPCYFILQSQPVSLPYGALAQTPALRYNTQKIE